MSFQIQWEIEGSRELSRVLNNVSRAAKDFKKPLGQSAVMLRKLFEGDVFVTEGAAIQRKWARLSPATVASKARSGYPFPTKPLVATGKMQKSFYTRVYSEYAVVGNNADYFKYHQSNKPRKRLPRRVMMRIDNERKVEIVRFFQAHLQAEAKRN